LILWGGVSVVKMWCIMTVSFFIGITLLKFILGLPIEGWALMLIGGTVAFASTAFAEFID